jgi:hypothetical protein
LETDRESIEQSDWLAGQLDKSVRSSVAKPKVKIRGFTKFTPFPLLPTIYFNHFIICICIFLNPSLQLKFKTLFSCTQLCSHTTTLVPYLCFKNEATLNFFHVL